MLQRIQTLYFAISIGLFFSLLSGIDLMTFSSLKEKKVQTVDVFGKTVYINDGTKLTTQSTQSFPLYIIVIGLVMLLFVTLMAYKKIGRQLKLSRFVMLLNVLLVIAFVVWNTYLFGASNNESTNSLGVGFYLLVSTVPLTFLGYKGVLKDKMLLDSIDRLR